MRITIHNIVTTLPNHLNLISSIIPVVRRPALQIVFSFIHRASPIKGKIFSLAMHKSKQSFLRRLCSHNWSIVRSTAASCESVNLAQYPSVVFSREVAKQRLKRFGPFRKAKSHTQHMAATPLPCASGARQGRVLQRQYGPEKQLVSFIYISTFLLHIIIYLFISVYIEQM